MELITIICTRSSTKTFYRKHLFIPRATEITSQLLVGEIKQISKENSLCSYADCTGIADGAPSSMFVQQKGISAPSPQLQ